MTEEITGTATGNLSGGSAASLAQAGAPVAPAAPAHRVTRKRNGQGKAKVNGNGSATTAANTNSRTISITLAKDTMEWFEQAASQAPFEPSVQRFIAWELKQMALAGQQRPVANLDDYQPGPGVSDPE